MEKIIENELEYSVALEAIEELMDRDPEPDSEDGKKLQLLTILVKDYESDSELLKFPDPIEAIKFRMEQQDLKQRDLIPYIGNRSKVSEVLSGKRPLTLDMIRALNNGLGIPAAVLVQESKLHYDDNDLDWEKFPVKEIVSRNWLCEPINYSKKNLEKIIMSFLRQLQPLPQFSAFYRANHNIRTGKKMDIYALYLWKVRILIKAKSIITRQAFNKKIFTKEILSELVKLSSQEEGPLKAIDMLNELGVIVAIEPHLPRTYLDGATIFIENNNPVIGLTIRFDRIDNFWFTLMHEVAHIYLHYDIGIESFFDDLEVPDNSNRYEVEADDFAREILIPREEWEKSPARTLKFPQAAELLAKELQIHPAIVAGRMRYEFNAYRLLNNLIGSKEVRKLFNNVMWR